MKEGLKNTLRAVGIYHPLQSAYRRLLNKLEIRSNRIHYAKYRGSGFTCNFCGARYSVFKPELPLNAIAPAINNNHVIAGYGENVFCPDCLSKNRERLVLAVIKDTIDFAGKSILHFSPEENIYRFLAKYSKVTTVDISPGFYRSVDRSVKYGDATSLEFSSAAFDLVIANHILEHIPDDRKAISEMFRVLKPGGVAILQVPFSVTIPSTLEQPDINDGALQERLYGQKDHVRIYAFDDFVSRVLGSGFRSGILSPAQLEKYAQFAIQKGEYFMMFHKPGQDFVKNT
ncbi:MAG: methyltransferase domain-containing protein [Flavitalea sp.]